MVGCTHICPCCTDGPQFYSQQKQLRVKNGQCQRQWWAASAMVADYCGVIPPLIGRIPSLYPWVHSNGDISSKHNSKNTHTQTPPPATVYTNKQTTSKKIASQELRLKHNELVLFHVVLFKVVQHLTGIVRSEKTKKKCTPPPRSSTPPQLVIF